MSSNREPTQKFVKEGETDKSRIPFYQAKKELEKELPHPKDERSVVEKVKDTIIQTVETVADKVQDWQERREIHSHVDDSHIKFDKSKQALEKELK